MSQRDGCVHGYIVKYTSSKYLRLVKVVFHRQETARWVLNCILVNVQVDDLTFRISVKCLCDVGFE